MNNNIGYFEALWMFLWNWIQHSGIYKLLRRVYDGISGAWRRSRITNWFRRETFSAEVLPSSLAGRFFRWPFTLLDWLRTRFGKSLSARLRDSAIIRCCSIYLQNFLGLEPAVSRYYHTWYRHRPDCRESGRRRYSGALQNGAGDPGDSAVPV